MGLFTAAGARLTKSTVPTAAADDPLVKITADVYKRSRWGDGDAQVDGTIKTLFAKAGTVMPQSRLYAEFPPPAIKQFTQTGTPIDVPVAGGAITITGWNFDGVTAITIGGVAVTNLVIVSPEKITCTAGTHAAGVVDVVFTDDAGTVTLTGAAKYA